MSDRYDLPCPWCSGHGLHILGCPSPEDKNDPRWARRLRAHKLLESYGTTDYGQQLMHLLEPRAHVADAIKLLEARAGKPVRCGGK